MGESVYGRISVGENQCMGELVCGRNSVWEKSPERSNFWSASTDFTTAVERSSITSKRLTTVSYVTRVLRKVTSQSKIKGLL